MFSTFCFSEWEQTLGGRRVGSAERRNGDSADVFTKRSCVVVGVPVSRLRMFSNNIISSSGLASALCV